MEELKIERVEFPAKESDEYYFVAAYCRVSCIKDASEHSLEAQKAFYKSQITSHPGWIFAGIYADELTGTKEDRAEFQRLLADCRAGKVNMILTKSISRFARNTVTLLTVVRELKGLGIDVFFEEQNIHTLSASGELMLTLLASFAQAESYSASENQKWRIRKGFKEGKLASGYMLGYRYKDGYLVVQPEEAETVRLIFDLYLHEGLGYVAIAKRLQVEGRMGRSGCFIGPKTVDKILRNYSYTGNLILQRYYRENHLTKRKLVNHGELPRYEVKDAHEAIIPMEVFKAVSQERKRRAAQYDYTGASPDDRETYRLRITCGCCGSTFKYSCVHGIPKWRCRKYSQQGKAGCENNSAIPQAVLEGLEPFDTAVSFPGRRLALCTAGEERETIWTLPSRSESWTEEKREAARKRATAPS